MTEDKAAKAAELPSDAEATGAAIAGSVARFNKPNVNARTMLLMPEFWTGIVEQMFGLAPPPEPPMVPETPEAPAATTKLTALSPDTAVVGGDDFVMTLTGTGFTADSVIVIGGTDVATTMNSDTELTTIVDPATAVAGVVPVAVRTGAEQTASLNFTFTA